MAKKIKVLILGATGIIGKELVKASLVKGYEVYAVSRGSKAVQAGSIGVIADARDSASLAKSIESLEFDTVIDLVSFDGNQATEIIEVIKNKCKQYVFISSATVYGKSSKDSPIRETSDRVASGWTYPLKKIESEDAVVDHCKVSGLEYTIVRPYITYSEQRISFGEWEGETILSAIANNRPVILGEELANSYTTLTHSFDLAAGIAGLIANPKAYGEDFHITSDETVTWDEVFKTAGRIIGVKPRVVDLSIKDIAKSFPELKGKIEDRCLGRVFDNSKIKSVVDGFECKYSLEDGYREVIQMALAKYIDTNGLVVGNIMQGRLDRVALAYADSDTRKDIIGFRSKLGLKARVMYSIGFYDILYKTALFARHITRGGLSDDYAVG